MSDTLSEIPIESYVNLQERVELEDDRIPVTLDTAETVPVAELNLSDDYEETVESRSTFRDDVRVCIDPETPSVAVSSLYSVESDDLREVVSSCNSLSLWLEVRAGTEDVLFVIQSSASAVFSELRSVCHDAEEREFVDRLEQILCSADNWLTARNAVGLRQSVVRDLLVRAGYADDVYSANPDVHMDDFVRLCNIPPERWTDRVISVSFRFK